MAHGLCEFWSGSCLQLHHTSIHPCSFNFNHVSLLSVLFLFFSQQTLCYPVSRASQLLDLCLISPLLSNTFVYLILNLSLRSHFKIPFLKKSYLSPDQVPNIFIFLPCYISTLGIYLKRFCATIFVCLLLITNFLPNDNVNSMILGISLI